MDYKFTTNASNNVRHYYNNFLYDHSDIPLNLTTTACHAGQQRYGLYCHVGEQQQPGLAWGG